jgi:dihydrofolate reductase
LKTLWKEWRALWATLFMGLAQRADEDTFYRMVTSTADVLQGRKSFQQMVDEEIDSLPPRVRGRARRQSEKIS